MPKSKKANPGDGCLFQRTRRIRGRVYLDSYVILTRNAEGRQISIPLRTKDRNRAREMLREWQIARSTGDDAEITGRIAVIDYNNRWLKQKELDADERGSVRPQTLVRYRNYIIPFNTYFGESGYEFLQMKDLKAAHLKGYQAWRLRQTRFGKPGGVPITPEGINREMKFLAGIFKGAYHDRLLARDPVKGLEKLKTTPKKVLLPSDAELLEVFRKIPDTAVRDYCMTISLTGMRAMEGMSRKFKHVDLEHGVLHICDDGDFKLKNANSARNIPLPNEMRDIVLRIMTERKPEDEDYLFVMPDGSPLMNHKDHAYHVVTSTLRAVNRIRRKNGIREIPYFHIRLLRHWFISWALNRPDNPLTETQLIKIVGHADFEMIRKTYYHFDLEGESGRKMRETPLFSAMDGTDAITVARLVKAAPATVVPKNTTNAGPETGGKIGFGYSLLGA